MTDGTKNLMVARGEQLSPHFLVAPSYIDTWFAPLTMYWSFVLRCGALRQVVTHPLAAGLDYGQQRLRLAAWIPASRAARLDPMQTLRQE